MTPPPSAPRRIRRRFVPAGLERGVRHLPRAATAREAPDPKAGRRDLEIVVATVVGMAAVLSGPLVWGVALLLLAATILGTLQLLADVDSPNADRGVPVESLIVPAVAALGAVGAIRLLPVGPTIVVGMVLAAILLDRALAIETRLVASAQGPTADDRSAALIVILVVALVAFGGVAAIVPGGLAGLEQPGAPVAPLPLANLGILVLADAAIGGLLGYRAAALRVSNARDALWAAASYAVAIAIGAAALRAMGIPRLVGPALLMLLFYLWDTLHSAPPSRRRDPRWLWETAILAGLGVAVIAWNLRLES
jgi:hypothetical protein